MLPLVLAKYLPVKKWAKQTPKFWRHTMFVTSTGLGFSFINRPNSYRTLFHQNIMTTSLQTNISILLKPNIQIPQSSYTCHGTTTHLFPASERAECSLSILIPRILVTIGSWVLAGGSLNQLTWHLNISFMSGSQNKNHDWFGFFLRPNYFVFRLSQSRAWCCQVSGLVLFELLLRTPVPLWVLGGSSCTVLSGSID